MPQALAPQVPATAAQHLVAIGADVSFTLNPQPLSFVSGLSNNYYCEKVLAALGRSRDAVCVAGKEVI